MKKSYRLKTGKHIGFDAKGNRVLFNAGDIVELTDIQYLSFKDKFVPEAVHAADTALNKAILEAQEEAKAKVIENHKKQQEEAAKKAVTENKPVTNK